MEPFRLVDLPYEIVLRVVHAVDERDRSPTFPHGPSDSLLALSLTNRWFAKICRPLKFRSIHYAPLAPGPHPRAYRQARSLAALNQLVVADSEIKVQQLSIQDMFTLWDDVADADDVHDDIGDVLRAIETLVARGLQVLFLRGLSFSRREADELFAIVAAAPRLSAIRFNQVDIVSSKSVLDELAPLNKIHTLQIMHGSSQLLNLVHKCPNLDSLLLWPSSRRLGTHVDTIRSLLPRLRLLSMDSVRDPTAFRHIAEEITRLATERYAERLPLEELFLEGPMTQADRSVLVSSLEHLPSLIRLALYQARDPTPTLFNEIYAAQPRLQSLTVMAGDCDGSVLWPCPLEEYLPSLGQFKSLEFYASDRRTPPSRDQLATLATITRSNPGGVSQSQLEFQSFGKLAKACVNLKQAVAIDQDVSEGTTGYFATFEREKGKIRISQTRRTANDFLVGYDRWIRVEDD
ncbi:hypothetical protein JCM3766R1_003310 [Sporobolomyces carnicolor]